MATGERRVDSLVSGGIVKNFVKGKNFRLSKFVFKTRFKQFPNVWLFSPAPDPPCIGFPGLTAHSDHIIVMTVISSCHFSYTLC